MYFVTYSIDIAALICLMWLTYSSTALNSNRKTPFLFGLILTLIVIVCEAGTLLAGKGSFDLRSLNILNNTLGFALTPIIPIVITFVTNKNMLLRHKILLLPTLIGVMAAVLSPLFGFIFYVDSSNQYFRGDYYFIFIASYYINLLFLFLSTLELTRKYNYPVLLKLIVLSLFVIIGTSVQLIVPTIYSTWHCVTLALFLFFLLISEFDSSFDILTGLYNRAAFEKAIKRLNPKSQISVIVFDIDDFKFINDTYGHVYGDTVIKDVAGIIREVFHKDFNCYRLGGDEFYLLGKETTEERLEELLRTFTNLLAEKRREGKSLPTVSYGYSISREGERLDFNKILKETDAQMYYYKKLHKANAAHK